ncbi:hypothetical protein Thal_0554 [Thermocrinis albus DSM 14484]|uniref:Uncharacterized protein n=1 Tax=Thermocrinis albus (strain DSM 14484 / JCM 11386 / HI 11/12) TaxID=638303 RepID=D3SPV1_THEAH|nr:hypothetical protein [Thermocrinis albus]ADC89188.1 hypothetical protein Thal_0554 [Thermocrinis albus DSM 14484]
MRRMLAYLLVATLGLFSASVDSYAKAHRHKVVKHHHHKVKVSYKYKYKKKHKKFVKRVRYSHNINKPQEGELLKLEGMVKDINEQ